MPVKRRTPLEPIGSARDLSLILGGSALANKDAIMKTPISTQARISISEGPEIPFRTQEINLDTQPVIRSILDAKPKRTVRPQKTIQPQRARAQTRGRILSNFPKLQYAREAIKKNLATLSRRL